MTPDPAARERLAALPPKQRGISRTQAAEIIGCSSRQAAELMRCGDLERFNVACSTSTRPRWYTTRESVRKFIDQGLIEGKKDDGVRVEVLPFDAEGDQS